MVNPSLASADQQSGLPSRGPSHLNLDIPRKRGGTGPQALSHVMHYAWSLQAQAVGGLQLLYCLRCCYAFQASSAKEMGFFAFARFGFSLSLRSADARRYYAAFLICIPVLTTAVHGLSGRESICRDPADGVARQVEEMKLEITRLEAFLGEITRSLSAKDEYFKEKEKQIEEMTQELHFLENAIVNIKESQDNSHYQERVQKLEEEVRLLWAESRKNNFNIHVLEDKARDSDDKLAELVSQFEKSIVTEQWIQIRQLEQALQIIEDNLNIFFAMN
ncbi:hypothetical protein ACLOJK_009822, partial [Asimina triloba]